MEEKASEREKARLARIKDDQRMELERERRDQVTKAKLFITNFYSRKDN